MMVRSWCAGLAVLLIASGYSLAAETNPYESSRRFVVEIKFGPYSPNIDSEFDGGQTPFEDLFDSGTGLMVQGEVDVQVWHGFGNIGLGFLLGYFSVSAETCLDDGSNADSAVASCRGADRIEGDKTSLTMLPMALLAVYRFDVMAERWSVPLVPYLKTGPTYTLWWMRRGDGDISSVPTSAGEEQKGRGGVWGWQINAGVGFQIDRLEPSASRKLDSDYGVNHTYLFVELLHALNFGEPRLGDTTFMGGLALEF